MQASAVFLQFCVCYYSYSVYCQFLPTPLLKNAISWILSAKVFPSDSRRSKRGSRTGFSRELSLDLFFGRMTMTRDRKKISLIHICFSVLAGLQLSIEQQNTVVKKVQSLRRQARKQLQQQRRQYCQYHYRQSVENATGRSNAIQQCYGDLHPWKAISLIIGLIK